MSKTKLMNIVTLILTLVFGYLAIINRITSEQYLTIFTMIMTFYFTNSSLSVGNLAPLLFNNAISIKKGYEEESIRKIFDLFKLWKNFI